MLLVFPFFLILVILLVDLGIALKNYQVVTNAAREGARRAVVADQATTAQISTTVQNWLSAGGVKWDGSPTQNLAYCSGTLPTTEVAAGKLEIYGCRWDSNQTGEPVRAAIRYGHELRWIGNLLGMVGASRTIRLQTDFWMRNEGL